MSHSDGTVVLVLFTLFTHSPSRILNYVALRHPFAVIVPSITPIWFEFFRPSLFFSDNDCAHSSIMMTHTDQKVYVCPQEDLNPYAASVDAFWKLMNSTKLMWTEDNKGRPLVRTLPKSM